MKKIISTILVLLLFSVTINKTHSYAETEEQSVSGYISTSRSEASVVLYEQGSQTKIYVDSDDYYGVIRAAEDLKKDITAVTDGDVAVINEIGNQGITLGENPTIEIQNGAEKESVGYIALYDKDGMLLKVQKSNNTISDDETVLTFQNEMNMDEGCICKGFVWSAGRSQAPVTPVLGIKNNTDLPEVTVGTIGNSDVIDSLIAQGKLDVSEIENKWESFTIQEVDGSIVVAGSDKRGTIYGIYDISEKIGVSPWYWWGDSVIEHSDNLYVNLDENGYTEGEPSVKYRGIFLNDEYNLNRWSKSLNSSSYMNTETYEKVFELLLRLKANYLWPAMHEYSPAFNLNAENAKRADEYGIVMGSSHSEILLRNNVGEWEGFYKEWKVNNPDKTLKGTDYESAYDFTDADGVANKEMLIDYWSERVRENKDYESTYTIGMRGIHDGGWSPSAASTNEEKVALMQEIFEAQRNIIETETGKDAKDVPQIFIPYKEMMTVYNAGLEVPDDVTLMWTDDNFGYVRQLSNETERERSGDAGVYYHISYYGSPKSYLWLTSTQLGQIREEMTKSYNMGADRVWLLNVGDLKPAETQIEYFLDLGRNINEVGAMTSVDYIAQNAMRDFGLDKTEAYEYADIHTKYLTLANSRRPEHMESGLFSLNAFGDEAQTLVDEYKELTERSEKLYNSLDEDKKPSFFERQLYPLRATYNAVLKYINAERSNAYYEQGRGVSANKYAMLSDAAHEQIVNDTNQYDTMLDSKWKLMMNPFQTKLASGSGTFSKYLETSSVEAVPYTQLNVTTEAGGTISFSGYSKAVKYIDIYNSGSDSLSWRASAKDNWIVLNCTSGTVYDEDRIYAGIDWDDMQPGIYTSEIVIERVINDTVVDRKIIEVEVDNETSNLPEKTYAEADGYVSIEAEHYSQSVTSGDYQWKTEDDFGRNGASVKFYPDIAEPVTDNSAYLEYDIYFKSSGTFDVDVYRMPTLNEAGTMRFAVGIDDAEPTVLKGQNAYVNKSKGTDAWGKGVLNNVQVLTTSVSVSEPGYHKIKLYGQDTGVVIDKLIVKTDADLSDSYFGAPESYNSSFNNEAETLPVYTPSSETEFDVINLFEAKVINTSVNVENGILNKIVLVKAAESEDGIVAVAGYDLNGAMTDMEMYPLELADARVGDEIVLTPDFDLSGAVEYQIMTFNNTDELQALSLAKTYRNEELSVFEYVNGNVSVEADMSLYSGREAILVIYNEAPVQGDIKYIRQTTAEASAFKDVYVGELDEGTYKIRIGVCGNVIDEEFSTVINSLPDNDGATEVVRNWDFDRDTDEYTEITFAGNVMYDTENGNIKIPSVSGKSNKTVKIQPSEPVWYITGNKLVVSFDVAFGRTENRTTSYEIYDTDGNVLTSGTFNAYANEHTITIGDTVVSEGKFPLGINRANNDGMDNGYATFTNVFDFMSGTVELTILNTDGSSGFKDKLQTGVQKNISYILFSSNMQYTDRGCYIDNVSISRVAEPQYKMTIVSDYDVSVFDGVTEALINPQSDGTYMLCAGSYKYTTSNEENGSFNVSPGMKSKEIVIQ